jgi:hypothetical protein
LLDKSRRGDLSAEDKALYRRLVSNSAEDHALPG